MKRNNSAFNSIVVTHICCYQNHSTHGFVWKPTNSFGNIRMYVSRLETEAKRDRKSARNENVTLRAHYTYVYVIFYVLIFTCVYVFRRMTTTFGPSDVKCHNIRCDFGKRTHAHRLSHRPLWMHKSFLARNVSFHSVWSHWRNETISAANPNSMVSLDCNFKSKLWIKIILCSDSA